MGKSKISIIIAKEYNTRVRKKSFILLTLLTPLLFGALLVVPSLIMMYSGSEKTTVSVADNTGIVMPYFKSSQQVSYNSIGAMSLNDIQANYRNYNTDVVVYISPLDSLKNCLAYLFAQKQVNMDIQQSVRKTIDEALKDNKLRGYDIPNLNDIMNDLKSNVTLKTFEISDDGGTKESKVEVSMGIGYVASFMIYMFVFMFGSMVMRSVIEEKSNRIVEVIVSSVKPVQLMMGKILGVALVALTQFVIWILLTAGIVFGVGMAIGQNGTNGLSAVAGQAQIVSVGNPSAGQIQLAADSIAEGNQTEIQSYMNIIKDINFTKIIAVFLIYFILGYLLYSSMFAAVGAACDNEADTQQLTLPITLPLIVGLFIMLHTFQYPDSSLSFWGSMIPFTSPMVMMARISYGVPFWQLALSVLLMIATFVFIAYLSSRIYRTGILMYGKKNSWKEMFKWLKNK